MVYEGKRRKRVTEGAENKATIEEKGDKIDDHNELNDKKNDDTGLQDKRDELKDEKEERNDDDNELNNKKRDDSALKEEMQERKDDVNERKEREKTSVQEERSVVDKIREKLKRKAPSREENVIKITRQELVIEQRKSGRKRMMINTVGRGVDQMSLQKAVKATYKRLQSREKGKKKEHMHN
ncbi:hypothetical protein THRCLA_20922 [Thraustotheca clavata]|uniref:Uncharacterized protein n=1 Tax=Thraustotheca clavata TaxID=74557 RepID=A0A1W0A269_9STRA|nr:hypothetical protein THRCLA_20922 [Thraustotheca clavata]